MTNTKTLENIFAMVEKIDCGHILGQIQYSNVDCFDTVRYSSGYSTAYFVKQTDCDFDLI